jgi:hypothetical protein
MIPKEIVWFSATLISWLLILLPVAAVFGYWDVFSWICVAILVITPVLLLSFLQAQVERRRFRRQVYS